MNSAALQNFQIDETKIIASREASTHASSWGENLCVRKISEKEFELFVGQFDVVGEASEFYNQKTNELEIPDEINGYPVQGVEEGYVIGGPIERASEYGEISFFDCEALEVHEWLVSINWNNTQIRSTICLLTQF